MVLGTWVCLVLALLAAAVMWGLGDRWWPGTALLFGPRWLLLLPFTLLIPALLLLRSRFPLRAVLPPLLLGLAVVLGPIMGLRFGWQGRLAPGQGETLRVATFNAAGNVEPVMRLLGLLQQWDIDVAAIQECDSDVPRVLESHVGWHVDRSRSLCLISRHPIEEAESTRWEELDVAAGAGAGQSGTAVRYRVRTGAGRELHLVNLHLETPRKGLERLRYRLELDAVARNTIIRAAGSRRAFEWLGEARAPLVVLGDFNMPVESRIYRAHWNELANAFSRAGWGFGYTKDNGWIRVRIDHVLLGSDWRARRTWTSEDLGSDHWAVFAEVVQVRAR